MADYVVASTSNGRLSFAVLYDPGPLWQKRFYPGQNIAVVEILAGDTFSIDDIKALHKQMPDASLDAIVNRLRMDREFLGLAS